MSSSVGRFNCIQNLLGWLEKQDVDILDTGENYFTLQCPHDAAVTVTFDADADIDDIIYETRFSQN